MDKLETILQEDLAQIYLGNLKTVEFDLDLPKVGKNGSIIRWESSDDRWLDATGHVTRPPFGRGNRVVQLTATLTQDAATLSKVFAVRILEAENDIQVAQVYPIHLTVAIGEVFYLPTAVAIKTKNQQVLTHGVTWSETAEISLNEAGCYNFSGNLTGLDHPVQAEVLVKEVAEESTIPPIKQHLYDLAKIRLMGDTAMKRAQDQRLSYLLTIDDDQMLYNFRQAAGLDTLGAPEMIGWDSPESKLRGHTTGHYLSALSLAYAATGDEVILEKLTYMITELAKVQAAFEADPAVRPGFLSGYSEEQFDLLEEYQPYPVIWAPYYTLHKILAGLLDSYTYGGLDLSLQIAAKLGTWTYQRLSRLSHAQLQKMWSMYIAGEYGGMNESLAELYRLTNDPKHLAAAKLFDNDRLFYPLMQKVDALGSMHANQHIPQVVGAMKLYQVTGEDRYFQLAEFFWQSVTDQHIYAMGGTGDGELFQQPNQIASHLSKNTAETCASYNLLKLTKELYQRMPAQKYLDYYEKVMFNHILATPDHDCGGESTYFMATQPKAQRFFEIENSCCHGTGMENHFKYGTMLYGYDEESVTINYFVSATLKDELTNVDLTVTADDRTPEKAVITVTELADRYLKIRKPSWATGVTIRIDGQSFSPELVAGYYHLPTDANKIELEFTLAFRMEATPDDPAVFAIYYGPYLLVALSETADFLRLALTPTTINEEMQYLPEKNHFSYAGITFIPAYELADEYYHMYIQQG